MEKQPAMTSIAGSVGAFMALAGFSVATLSGLYVGNEGWFVLRGAILSLIGCYLVGYGLGVVGEFVVRNSVKSGVQPEAASEQGFTKP